MAIYAEPICRVNEKISIRFVDISHCLIFDKERHFFVRVVHESLIQWLGLSGFLTK